MLVMQIAKEEAQLDFMQPATHLHNKIRAYAGWPGTVGTFVISSNDDIGTGQQQQVKILQSRVARDPSDLQQVQSSGSGQVVFAGNGSRMLVPCGEGSVLEVLLLQPPTKKAMVPKAFHNGLAGKLVHVAKQ